jgi:hypothetical protein
MQNQLEEEDVCNSNDREQLKKTIKNFMDEFEGSQQFGNSNKS